MTNPELIETAKEQVNQDIQSQVIYLFGSYVWGNLDEQIIIKVP